jgi:hypothetical protein
MKALLTFAFVALLTTALPSPVQGITEVCPSGAPQCLSGAGRPVGEQIQFSTVDIRLPQQR